MRSSVALACLALGLPANSLAQDLVAPIPSGNWFVQTRAIAGLSHAPGAFTTLPPLATGGDQTSYQPQEYFGVGVGLGREITLFGVPARAVVDTSLNFRHDTDVDAQSPGGTLDYQANLQTLDLRLSLLADVLDFGWGRFYVGAGLGAARVRTEVEIDGTPVSVENIEWKASPSVEAGIAFTGFSQRVIPQLSYRFRWIGDVESDVFPTGETLAYEDFHVHDLMFGFKIPLVAYTAANTDFVAPEPLTVASEAFWTGFHVGAFGGWAKSDDMPVDGLSTPAGVPYNAANTYALDGDGPLAGGEIGVDWQWRWFVLGLAGEAGWMNLDASSVDPASPGGDTETTFESDWYGALTARGGLAYDRLLAYGRVGVVYLSAEAETVDACTAAPCGPTIVSAAEDDILFGFTAGAGLEYALGAHWSAGAEYRYFNIFDDLQPNDAGAVGGPFAQNVGIDRIHTARASVNFRW